MKYVKVYEEYKLSKNHVLINNFCANYDNIYDYSINSDNSIDVNQDVDISIGDLYKIPIKFNRVNGDFNCYNNNLTTLENCPINVIGSFDCSNNNLTTLMGGPKHVNDDYFCYDNNLKDLYGFPDFFKGFLCIKNKKSRIMPIYELISLISLISIKDSLNKKMIKFIKFLNEYQVIRNQDTIIESRLMDALYEVDITSLKKSSFQNYRLI